MNQKERALSVLVGNWGPAIIALFIPTIIAGLITTILPAMAFLGVLLWPINIGITVFYMNLRNSEAEIGNVFTYYTDLKEKFGAAMLLYFIKGLLILLWTLLLIVPGIIKAFSYALSDYKLVDDDFKLEGMEALELSERMMKGKKMDLFFLGLSFIGWILLGGITFGIVFL